MSLDKKLKSVTQRIGTECKSINADVLYEAQQRIQNISELTGLISAEQNRAVAAENTKQDKLTAGGGLSLSGATISHSNSVTAATAGTSSATSGNTISVPYVTYDAQGHVTATGTHTHTVSVEKGLSITDSKIGHTNSVTANTTSGLKFFTYDAQGHINAATNKTLGRGLSDSSNVIGHSNSVTAATAGTSSDTSGNTIAVPYVTYDAQGHITKSGTHTHTIGTVETFTFEYSDGTSTTKKLIVVS